MKHYTKRLLPITLIAVLMAALLPGLAADAQGDPPNGLPLLPAGRFLGVIFTEPAPEYSEPLHTAWDEALNAGVNTYELSIAWSELEPAPGVYDTSLLESYLFIMHTLNMPVYLAITTINTVKLTLPADLVDPNDPARLAEGRHFDDPVIQQRFNALLDVVVPLMVENGGFFISIANEIDGWLLARPAEIDPFVNFLAASRAHAHSLEPRMGIGATIMFGAVAAGHPLVERVIAHSDAAVFTYYPLGAGYMVREPDVVAGDMALMLAAAGDLPVLMQEVGYPAGYLTTPQNGSSGEKQRQFVAEMFAVVEANPQIRFISFLQLGDWSAETCDFFSGYYGESDPRFVEYLCTLGMVTHEGQRKPAWAEFIAGVEALR